MLVIITFNQTLEISSNNISKIISETRIATLNIILGKDTFLLQTSNFLVSLIPSFHVH